MVLYGNATESERELSLENEDAHNAGYSYGEYQAYQAIHHEAPPPKGRIGTVNFWWK